MSEKETSKCGRKEMNEGGEDMRESWKPSSSPSCYFISLFCFASPSHSLSFSCSPRLFFLVFWWTIPLNVHCTGNWIPVMNRISSFSSFSFSPVDLKSPDKVSSWNMPCRLTSSFKQGLSSTAVDLFTPTPSCVCVCFSHHVSNKQSLFGLSLFRQMPYKWSSNQASWTTTLYPFSVLFITPLHKVWLVSWITWESFTIKWPYSITYVDLNLDHHQIPGKIFILFIHSPSEMPEMLNKKSVGDEGQKNTRTLPTIKARDKC